MAALGRVIAEALVHEYGRDELLRRLAHPFWFQSFGAVMGMDWHSSGITTSVIGALKRGLAPMQRELGIYVCGGKGAQSRRTPHELFEVAETTGVDAAPLVRASRLVAKIDHAAVQDGFDLYLHAFITTVEGHWCVIQQGMNDAASVKPAVIIGNQRRCRVFSNRPIPQSKVATWAQSSTWPMPARSAIEPRVSSLRAEDRIARSRYCVSSDSRPMRRCRYSRKPRPPPPLPHLQLPHHHEVRMSDVMLRRLHGTLAAAADAGPKDYADLLLTPGVGGRTVQALAFVAEVLHGTPSRFSDPARFSLAHGGKDGHPFPVPIKVLDETIRLLKRAVARAKLGSTDALAAIRRLDAQARALESTADGPTFESIIAGEQQNPKSLGGRRLTGR